jgi:hypothetical protein
MVFSRFSNSNEARYPQDFTAVFRTREGAISAGMYARSARGAVDAALFP